MLKFTELLNSIIDFIIFWDGWGSTSQLFLVGLLLFIVACYIIIRKYYDNRGKEKRLKW